MENSENNKERRRTILVIILIIIFLLLLYSLIRRFGNIEHHGPWVPTGNVDIFEIECGCNICEDTEKTYKEIDTDENKIEDILVFDDYKIWDNKELRIFENPAYEYQSIIAPGSENSYTYVIRNNNYFDVVVDITFEEENEKDINMQFKLKSKGKYLIGSQNEYELIKDKKLTNILIPAKSQVSYILDWKWIDSENDTEIGFDPTSQYKLSIHIGANRA